LKKFIFSGEILTLKNVRKREFHMVNFSQEKYRKESKAERPSWLPTYVHVSSCLCIYTFEFEGEYTQKQTPPLGVFRSLSISL